MPDIEQNGANESVQAPAKAVHERAIALMKLFAAHNIEPDAVTATALVLLAEMVAAKLFAERIVAQAMTTTSEEPSTDAVLVPGNMNVMN